MYDWTDFDTVFRPKSDFNIDNKHIESINQERKAFGGVLFFDRIWTSIGLKQPQKAYPPKSNADLRSIWTKVVSTAVSEEQKQAVLLYILRDCSNSGGSKILPHVDTTFAAKSYLPLKYQILISGLWELDHAHFSRALEYLTDPTLSAEFADDILVTLIRSSKCDEALAMAYYTTVLPPLVKSETLEAYFALLLRTNLAEAYHFAKVQETTRHKMLFEAIIRSVHEVDDATTRASQARLLLGLPFTAVEEQWYEDYLTHGTGKELPNAKDSVLMRRFATSKPLDDDGSLGRYRGQRIDGVDWNEIRSLQQNGIAGV